MTKKKLREKYKALRGQFSQDEIQERSLAIANSTLNLPIWKKEYYHIFMTIETQNEVDTNPMLSILSGMDKHIVLSKSDFKTSTMTHFLLTDNTRIVINSWNIPEPENGIPIATNLIDVVFVPLLAYDKKGNRVGYGKGFYDGFLNECKPETVKIGLSFFEAEVQITDVYTHDIKLDYCVSPFKIYEF